ncbi:MAG: DUF2378 family protein [Myxococcota bacterium]
MSDDGLSPGSPFCRPTFTGPLDLEERLGRAPSDGQVKGMFFRGIAEESSRLAGERVGRERYVLFRGYPLREWLEFMPAAARAAYPHVDPREGMRRFGHGAFGVFLKSTAGRVLFSMAGQNPGIAVGLTGRAFEMIGSHGRVEMLENEQGRAILAFEEMYDWVEAWHVGIIEGALRAFGASGEVRAKMHDIANGQLEVHYE